MKVIDKFSFEELFEVLSTLPTCQIICAVRSQPKWTIKDFTELTKLSERETFEIVCYLISKRIIEYAGQDEYTLEQGVACALTRVLDVSK